MSSVPSSSKTSDGPVDASDSQKKPDAVVGHAALLAQRDQDIAFHVKKALPKATEPDMDRSHNLWHILLKKGLGRLTDPEWEDDGHGPKLVNHIRRRMLERSEKEEAAALRTPTQQPLVAVKEEEPDEDVVLDALRRAQTEEGSGTAEDATPRLQDEDQDVKPLMAALQNPPTTPAVARKGSRAGFIILSSIFALLFISLAVFPLHNGTSDTEQSKLVPGSLPTAPLSAESLDGPIFKIPLGTQTDVPSKPPPPAQPIVFEIPYHAASTKNRPLNHAQGTAHPLPPITLDIVYHPSSTSTHLDSYVEEDDVCPLLNPDTALYVQNATAVCLLRKHPLVMGSVLSFSRTFDFLAEIPPIPSPTQWNPLYPSLTNYIPREYQRLARMVSSEFISILAIIIPFLSPGTVADKPLWIRQTLWLAPRAVLIQGLLFRVVQGLAIFHGHVD